MGIRTVVRAGVAREAAEVSPLLSIPSPFSIGIVRSLRFPLDSEQLVLRPATTCYCFRSVIT